MYTHTVIESGLYCRLHTYTVVVLLICNTVYERESGHCVRVHILFHIQSILNKIESAATDKVVYLFVLWPKFGIFFYTHFYITITYESSIQFFCSVFRLLALLFVAVYGFQFEFARWLVCLCWVCCIFYMFAFDVAGVIRRSASYYQRRKKIKKLKS